MKTWILLVRLLLIELVGIFLLVLWLMPPNVERLVLK